MAGQTLHDRLNAARHTLSGQNLARAVCKATTEEIIGPKKKHLDYLIHCTNEPNVSVPELCNLLIERTQQSSWVIVFKALITAHHLMCYGNERFVQCMATSSCKFHLGNFVDKAATHGYEMSTFVRRYAKYLNVKAAAYRTMGADFCKMKRGKDEGVLRNMSTESLLKTIPVLQEQLDTLIDFDCNPDDLSNGVMNSCFMLLYRDLIQLFAVYNDGIINLFEKFFNMNKKHCKEALDIYKKFIIVMDKVSDFLKVAESVGIDKGNIPDLTKAPASLLEEMESHLTYLEGRKGHTTTPTMPSRANSIQNAVSALNSTGTSFTTSITTTDEINGLTIDESMRRAVEEEAAVMNQMKVAVENKSKPELLSEEQKLKEMTRRTASDVSTPKIPSPLPPPSSQAVATTISPPGKTKETIAHTSTAKTTNSLGDLMSINPVVGQPQTFQQVPLGGFPMEGPQSSGFVSEDAFKSAFQSAATQSFDAFGQVLQPQSSVSPPSSSPVPESSESKSSPTSAKLISNDLDSSLQSLVQNLDINGGKKLKSSGHQWGSPKPSTKTGGTNWIPSSVPMTNYGTPQAMQPMPGGGQFPVAAVVNAPVYAYQPTVPGMVPQQQFMVQGMWASPPAGFGVINPPVQNVILVQPQPTAVRMVAQPSPQRSMAEGTATNPPPTAGWPASNDPFGAL